MEQTPDLSQLLRLAQSPAGQQLIALLQQSGGQELRSAVTKASAGDYTQAKQTLSGLLEKPEIKQLLRKMEEDK